MNLELNIHYAFGQIKPEYRGKDVLVVSAGLSGRIRFNRTPIDSLQTISITENPNCPDGYFPVRTYVGVNEMAEKHLDAFCASNTTSAFGLDGQIVSKPFVDQTLAAVRALSQSGLRMAVEQGS